MSYDIIMIGHTSFGNAYRSDVKSFKWFYSDSIPSHDYCQMYLFKSVSMRKPGRTRQEVIQLKSPTLLKLGINVGFCE